MTLSHLLMHLNQAGAKSSLAGLLLDAAKVKLLNDKIFNYARFVDNHSFGIVGVIEIEKAWDQIHRSAQGLVFLRDSPDIFFADLNGWIHSYKEHNTSPWIESSVLVTESARTAPMKESKAAPA